MAVIVLDDVRRTCVRCAFDLPLTSFPAVADGRGRRRTCAACLPAETAFLHVTSAAVNGRLRCDAVAALLAMQLTVAATRILAGERWPRLAQARAMQRAALMATVPKQP